MSWGRWLLAFAMPLAMVAGSAAIGWLLHEITSLVSGQPNPSYAFTIWLRISLALGVKAVGRLVSRFAYSRPAALAVWFWMAGLGVVTAALLPGLSPYFLFPALAGSVILLAQSRLRGAWSGTSGELAILLAALPALVIWLSLVSGAESVQGLLAHPLFTVPAAFGSMTVLPFLSIRPFVIRGWMTASWCLSWSRWHLQL